MERKDKIIHAKRVDNESSLESGEVVGWEVTFTGTTEEANLIINGLRTLETNIHIGIMPVTEGLPPLSDVHKLLGEISTASSVSHEESQEP